jgi:tripartite-type tricarboxylate transporter receptor subunit TctC
LQALADVPTMAEAGYPDIEFDNWFGVFVPAGTPGEIIAHLNREIAKSMAVPDVKECLVALGFDPVGGTPEEFATQIKIELEKWVKVIRAANIKAQ